MGICFLPKRVPAKLRRCIAPSLLLGTALVLSCLPPDLLASGEEQVLRLIGPQDAVILAGPDNALLLHKHADEKLIPASTLKLVSALAVMECLGRDYRFETHVYAGPDNAITIKGFGDPLLISEIVTDMVAAVRRAARQRNLQIQRLYVDDSYFKNPSLSPVPLRRSSPTMHRSERSASTSIRSITGSSMDRSAAQNSRPRCSPLRKN